MKSVTRLLNRGFQILREEGALAFVKQIDRKLTHCAIDLIARYRWELKPPLRAVRKAAKFFLLLLPAAFYFALTGRGFVRLRRSILAKKPLPGPEDFKILFIYWFEPVWHTKRYRVDNLRVQLDLYGIKSDAICVDEARCRIALRGFGWLEQYSVIVLFRVAADPYFNELVEAARKANIIPVYSGDDFVFDPDALDFIDAYKRTAPEERRRYREGTVYYRQLLKACDYFIASTRPLFDKGEELGKKSFIIRNGLNDFQIEESARALQQRKPHPGEIRIGYFSGTATHQKDFAEAAPAISRLLKEHSNLRLYIGGYLDLGQGFNKFQKQVVRLPFVDWEKLPHEIAKVDIQIVPLELNNPFTNAKSELKYFEAALLKIPTVASPTTPYRFAIRNGKNGFLAANTDEWYHRLKSLIEDGGLRKKLGDAAYQHTIATYTPKVQAPKTKEVFEEIVKDFRKTEGELNAQ